MHNILVNLFGYTAAVVGTSIMLPQVFKSFKTKRTGDLSMVMVIIYIVNCCLWLVYGFLLFSMPLILANAISFVIGTVQLFLKLKYNN